MDKRINILLIVVAFLIQPFLSAMLPMWLVPNLVFCIIMIMAATMDPEDMVLPMSIAFLLTLFQDYYYSQYVGVTVIALVITMLIVMFLRRVANIENPLFAALIVVSANLIYAIVYWAIYAMLSSPYSFLYMLSKLPPVIIPNVIVMFVALFIISRDIIQKRRDGYFR